MFWIFTQILLLNSMQAERYNFLKLLIAYRKRGPLLSRLSSLQRPIITVAIRSTQLHRQLHSLLLASDTQLGSRMPHDAAT